MSSETRLLAGFFYAYTVQNVPDSSNEIRGHQGEVLGACDENAPLLLKYAPKCRRLAPMLTVREIDSAKPKAKSYKLADGAGLYLEVMPTGAKYWRLKYRIAGKETRLAFGVYPEVRPPEAREKARNARDIRYYVAVAKA